jgi:hypothetical protein
MMQMPMLQGLVDGVAATAKPGALTELLDMLLPEEIQQLEQMATGAAGDDADTDGPIGEEAGDEEVTVGAGAAPGDGTAATVAEGHSEVGETLEEEAAEAPEDQEAQNEADAEDFDGIKQQVDAAAEEAAGYREALDGHLATAKENAEVGGDEKAVQKLIDQADKLMADVEDLQQEAQDAIDDENAGKAAEYGLQIQEKCQVLQGLETQAEAAATQNKAAKGASKNAKVAEEGEPEPALSLWSKRFRQQVG